MSQSAPAIVWFREDLRLSDNPALHAAVASHRPLILLYIHDEETDGLRHHGGLGLGRLLAMHLAVGPLLSRLGASDVAGN